jgi:putative transposase
VLDTLDEPRFADLAPAQVYATMLDEGRYLCSERTMYRILQANQETRERRDQLRHPRYAAPELLATRPNELWSWDITKLLGPAKWTTSYVILDVFSRYVVGWMVAHRESATLAEQFIRETCARQGIGREQLTVHADRGPTRPSPWPLLPIWRTKTHARPHVSNDNPFSEAHFKTLKYRPDFPERFGSIQHARAHGTDFFQWYNFEHHHSALGLLTPAVVHHGLSQGVIDKRREVLARAYVLRPQRFVKGAPKVAGPPPAVWINPPREKTANENAPGSTIAKRDDLELEPISADFSLVGSCA